MKGSSMPSLDETMAALPMHLARPWPDGVPGPSPNEQGLCDCCFWPMAGDKVWFNGGFCHARCAAEHERAIQGPDPGPGLLDVLEHLDAMNLFLGHLDREAAALGIDRDLLARAIERASHA